MREAVAEHYLFEAGAPPDLLAGLIRSCLDRPTTSQAIRAYRELLAS